MQITKNEIKKPTSEDFIEAYNNNATILDEHISNKDIHVKVCNIAGIAQSDELKQIDCTDTNRTLWGKIKKTISVLIGHLDKAASETTLGHIKIGTGLEMQDGVAKVKIVNDLTTNDSSTVLSAAMGVELNNNFTTQLGKLDPEISSVRVTKYGKVCVVEGIYTITQALGNGVYEIGTLSFMPHHGSDVSIVNISSPQSVAGGCIDDYGLLRYQVATSVKIGDPLRIMGVYIAK
ncbi:hypothetical protein [Lachnotalea glycerini]|uniref:Uncharacterized protein n=1 Tax=Lachnotalea glycerini TaxID=1763509 RepID=A0A371JC70_9FIRM|nr:hypothetical protein [Lachnotalea glycerini]RDY30360.1 hypothetical protein CG710_014975 [Lachnotalea glycerini]